MHQAKLPQSETSADMVALRPRVGADCEEMISTHTTRSAWPQRMQERTDGQLGDDANDEGDGHRQPQRETALPGGNGLGDRVPGDHRGEEQAVEETRGARQLDEAEAGLEQREAPAGQGDQGQRRQSERDADLGRRQTDAADVDGCRGVDDAERVSQDLDQLRSPRSSRSTT